MVVASQPVFNQEKNKKGIIKEERMTKTKQIVSYELLKEISDRTYQRRREAERECRRRERLRKEAQGVDKRKLRNIYKDIERKGISRSSNQMK